MDVVEYSALVLDITIGKNSIIEIEKLTIKQISNLISKIISLSSISIENINFIFSPNSKKTEYFTSLLSNYSILYRKLIINNENYLRIKELYEQYPWFQRHSYNSFLHFWTFNIFAHKHGLDYNSDLNIAPYESMLLEGNVKDNIINAIKHGKIEFIKLTDKCNKFSNFLYRSEGETTTPIHTALAYNQIEIFKFILKKYQNFTNLNSIQSKNLLEKIVYHDNPMFYKQVIKIIYFDQRHQACSKGSPNHKNDILFHVLKKRDINKLNYFLTKGNNVYKVNKVLFRKLKTIAAKNEDFSTKVSSIIEKIYSQKQSIINAIARDNIDLLRYYSTNGANLNFTLRDTNTLLMHAIKHDSIKSALFLIKNSTKLNVKNKDKKTALTLAIEYFYDDTSIINELLSVDKVRYPDLEKAEYDFLNSNPIMLASRLNNSTLLRFIMKKVYGNLYLQKASNIKFIVNINLNIPEILNNEFNKMIDEYKALHNKFILAIKNTEISEINALAKQVNINEKSCGYTPVQICVKNASLNLSLNHLIYLGANLEIRDSYNRLPITQALSLNNYEAYKSLLPKSVLSIDGFNKDILNPNDIVREMINLDYLEYLKYFINYFESNIQREDFSPKPRFIIELKEYAQLNKSEKCYKYLDEILSASNRGIDVFRNSNQLEVIGIANNEQNVDSFELSVMNSIVSLCKHYDITLMYAENQSRYLSKQGFDSLEEFAKLIRVIEHIDDSNYYYQNNDNVQKMDIKDYKSQFITFTNKIIEGRDGQYGNYGTWRSKWFEGDFGLDEIAYSNNGISIIDAWGLAVYVLSDSKRFNTKEIFENLQCLSQELFLCSREYNIVNGVDNGQAPDISCVHGIYLRAITSLSGKHEAVMILPLPDENAYYLAKKSLQEFFNTYSEKKVVAHILTNDSFINNDEHKNIIEDFYEKAWEHVYDNLQHEFGFLNGKAGAQGQRFLSTKVILNLEKSIRSISIELPEVSYVCTNSVNYFDVLLFKVKGELQSAAKVYTTNDSLWCSIVLAINSYSCGHMLETISDLQGKLISFLNKSSSDNQINFTKRIIKNNIETLKLDRLQDAFSTFNQHVARTLILRIFSYIYNVTFSIYDPFGKIESFIDSQPIGQILNNPKNLSFIHLHLNGVEQFYPVLIKGSANLVIKNFLQKHNTFNQKLVKIYNNSNYIQLNSNTTEYPFLDIFLQISKIYNISKLQNYRDVVSFKNSTFDNISDYINANPNSNITRDIKLCISDLSGESDEIDKLSASFTEDNYNYLKLFAIYYGLNLTIIENNCESEIINSNNRHNIILVKDKEYKFGLCILNPYIEYLQLKFALSNGFRQHDIANQNLAIIDNSLDTSSEPNFKRQRISC